LVFYGFIHKTMKNSTEKKKKILEMSPGTHPNIDYLKHDFVEYYVLDKIK
jgi:hypothetical protein